MKMHAVVVNKDVAGDVEVVERELRPLEYGEAWWKLSIAACATPTCTLRQAITATNRVACWDTKASVWLKKLLTV